jgi:iron complex outermembrane receptor protein
VVRSASVIQALTANGVTIDPAIFTGPSGTVGVVSFVNGLDTLTQGVDLVATYSTLFDSFGRIDWSFSGNYNATTIKRVAPPPSNVAQSVVLFDVPSRSNIKTATPKWRATFGALWSLGALSVNLRESFYGASYVYQQTPIGTGFDKIGIKAKVVTDLEAAYEVRKGIRVAVGANNLFNLYPTKSPGGPGQYRQEQFDTTSSGFASSVYPNFSPIGINGGFYYARLTVSF